MVNIACKMKAKGHIMLVLFHLGIMRISVISSKHMMKAFQYLCSFNAVSQVIVFCSSNDGASAEKNCIILTGI